MGGQCSTPPAGFQGCRDRACCRRDPGNILQDFSASRLRQHAGMDEWEAGDQDDMPGAAREAVEDTPSRADTAPPLPRETELDNDDCAAGIPEMVPEPPELRGQQVSASTKHEIPNLDLKNLDNSDRERAEEVKHPKPCPEGEDVPKGASGKEVQKAGKAAVAVSKAKAKAKTAASKAKSEAKQSSTIPEWLQSLAGLWLDAANLKPLATLQEGKVSWVGYAGHPPSALKALSGKKLCMAINGKEHVATLLPGSPPRLEWDDSSTWIREELQGTWKNFEEDRMIGQIKDGHIHWDPIFETPEPTALSPKAPLPQATMKMELCGETCTGTFHAELPAILKWSDGEMWTRVGMSR